jgi:hypothetical protein
VELLSDIDSFILVARYSANLILPLCSFKVSFSASLSVTGAFDRLPIYGSHRTTLIADWLASKG